MPCAYPDRQISALLKINGISQGWANLSVALFFEIGITFLFQPLQTQRTQSFLLRSIDQI
jgi:uncharacterized membrane protein